MVHCLFYLGWCPGWCLEVDRNSDGTEFFQHRRGRMWEVLDPLGKA